MNYREIKSLQRCKRVWWVGELLREQRERGFSLTFEMSDGLHREERKFGGGEDSLSLSRCKDFPLSLSWIFLSKPERSEAIKTLKYSYLIIVREASFAMINSSLKSFKFLRRRASLLPLRIVRVARWKWQKEWFAVHYAKWTAKSSAAP